MNLRYTENLFPINAKDDIEKVPTTKAEENAMVRVLAQQAALIELIRPDDPTVTAEARRRVAREIMDIKTPEELLRAELPIDSDNPLERLPVIVEDLVSGGREEAISMALEQHLLVQVPDTDTGEITPIPVGQYIAAQEERRAAEAAAEVPRESKLQELRRRGGVVLRRLVSFA